jgi:hypothetical protein
MLNITESGDITLTLHGKLIATLYAPYCDEITPKQIVTWENTCRRDYYESTGIWTETNKHKEKQGELKMREIYPLYPMRPDSVIDEQYAKKRNEWIDS